MDERHYDTEGERDTFVVHFFHAPSGETVAPDWDATSWSVSVIRVTDATYRAAFAEARRIAAGETSPTLFSVSLETAEPNGPGILRLFGTDLNMEGLDLDLDSHAAKREMFAEFFSRDRTAPRDRGSGAQPLTDWRPGASWHRASSPSRAARDELLVL